MNLRESLSPYQDPYRIILALNAVHALTIVQRNASIEGHRNAIETNRGRHEVSMADVESLENGEFDALLIALAAHQRFDVWSVLKQILLHEPRLIRQVKQNVPGWVKHDPTHMNANQLDEYLDCYHRHCIDRGNRLLAGAVGGNGVAQYGQPSSTPVSV